MGSSGKSSSTQQSNEYSNSYNRSVSATLGANAFGLTNAGEIKTGAITTRDIKLNSDNSPTIFNFSDVVSDITNSGSGSVSPDISPNLSPNQTPAEDGISGTITKFLPWILLAVGVWFVFKLIRR